MAPALLVLFDDPVISLFLQTEGCCGRSQYPSRTLCVAYQLFRVFAIRCSINIACLPFVYKDTENGYERLKTIFSLRAAIYAKLGGTRLHETFMRDGNKYDNMGKKYLL